MDSYDRCTNLEKEIFPILLPSMVEAENYSDHPRIIQRGYGGLWTIFIYFDTRSLTSGALLCKGPLLWLKVPSLRPLVLLIRAVFR